MRSTCLFFSLLLAVSALAQPSPINRRAMVLSGLAAGPLDIPSSIGLTITNRWMASHFSKTNSSISAWPDETNSYYFTLQSGSSSLTNSVNGMWADQTHCMFASNNVWKDGRLSKWMLFTAIKPGTTAGAQAILFNDASSGLGFGVSFQGAAPPPHRLLGPNLDTAENGVTTNIFYNVIITAAGTKMYTNGVLGATGSLFNFAGNVNMGSQGTSDPHGWLGYLTEFIIFVDTNMTSVQISNMNYYGTPANYPNFPK